MNHISKFSKIFTFFVIICVSILALELLHEIILVKIDNFNTVSDLKENLENSVKDPTKLKYHSQNEYICFKSSGGEITDSREYCNVYVFYDKTSKKKMYVVEDINDGFNYYDEDDLPKDILNK